MNFQKIKSILAFFVPVFLLFYLATSISPEPTVSFSENRSARLLEVVATLDTIDFDIDFINSFGNTSLKTVVYIPDISSSDPGRDNPFMRSGGVPVFEGIVNALEEAFSEDERDLNIPLEDISRERSLEDFVDISPEDSEEPSEETSEIAPENVSSEIPDTDSGPESSETSDTPEGGSSSDTPEGEPSSTVFVTF